MIKKTTRARKPYSKLAKSTKITRKYQKAVKGVKPGTGKRFKAMEEVGKERGLRDPEAFAAVIGRRKYGAKRMAKMAAAGRRRAAAKRAK